MIVDSIYFQLQQHHHIERDLNINSSNLQFRPLHSLGMIDFSAVAAIILEYSDLQNAIHSHIKKYVLERET